MRYGILFFLLAFSLQAQADAFKCRTPTGDVVFSDVPCDKGEVITKVKPAESVGDPVAAQREVERQKAIADRTAAENEAARKKPAGVASMPDYSSPPPKWPDPTPVSPSWTVGR
jgi:hypothetical protein